MQHTAIILLQTAGKRHVQEMRRSNAQKQQANYRSARVIGRILNERSGLGKLERSRALSGTPQLPRRFASADTAARGMRYAATAAANAFASSRWRIERTLCIS